MTKLKKVWAKAASLLVEGEHMKREIIANRAGDVLGVYYKAGESVPITEKQAAKMMSPYDDQLVFKKLATAKSTSKPGKVAGETGDK